MHLIYKIFSKKKQFKQKLNTAIDKYKELSELTKDKSYDADIHKQLIEDIKQIKDKADKLRAESGKQVGIIEKLKKDLETKKKLEKEHRTI